MPLRTMQWPVRDIGPLRGARAEAGCLRREIDAFNKHLGGLDAAEMLKAASMAPKGAAAGRWKKAGTKLAVASMFQRPVTKSMRLM